MISDIGERINVARPPVVLDLGAAPGGWSQVVANKLGVKPRQLFEEDEDATSPRYDSPRTGFQQPASGGWGEWSPSGLDEKRETPSPPAQPTIIALDLQEMQPIVGVKTLELSFLDPQAERIIADMISMPGIGDSPYRDRPEIDLILSDMAPKITGIEEADSAASMRLCTKVFDFATRYLRVHKQGRGHGFELGGHLVMKFFACAEAQTFRMKKLRKAFKRVYHVKPPASRSESSEAYWVCKDFLGNPGDFPGKHDDLDR